MHTSRIALLESFACLGAECPDTCCQGWQMQVDAPRLERYQKQHPELLEAVEGIGTPSPVMRKNSDGFCVKLEGGLCGVQKQYGADALGDACYFYPRITRKLGEHVVVSAALSCPEIARLALTEQQPLTWRAFDAERLPLSCVDYLPEGLTSDAAGNIHHGFILEASRSDALPSLTLARIQTVARSLARLPVASWEGAATLGLKLATERLGAPEIEPADKFRLAQLLAALMRGAPASSRTRLEPILERMCTRLLIAIDRTSLHMAPVGDSISAATALNIRWNEGGEAACATPLRFWIGAQLSGTLFPFAGLAKDPVERITLLAVKYSLLVLALQTLQDAEHLTPTPEQVVEIAQPLARLLDHLASAELILRVCEEVGWLREARLLGLLGITATR
jgi:hypothetical protein